MAYDPKKRPVFLGFEHMRTHPDRLKTGVLSVADSNENKIEPIPTAGAERAAQILNIIKIIVTVLAGIAASIIAAAAGGAQIPPVLLSIAGVVAAIASALGIASSGVGKQKPEDKGSSLQKGPPHD